MEGFLAGVVFHVVEEALALGGAEGGEIGLGGWGSGGVVHMRKQKTESRKQKWAEWQMDSRRARAERRARGEIRRPWGAATAREGGADRAERLHRSGDGGRFGPQKITKETKARGANPIVVLPRMPRISRMIRKQR